MIRLDAVSVFRSGKAILEGVDLGLLAGGVTTILGANGAGKRTVVRLLGGGWRPGRGGVWGADRPVRRGSGVGA
ncbi:MAG TPA: ATP-binding cassette domain-containing protein, partial [Kiritimatiellia bacterium]|nr:ATP-binding cassette domain-containing protein [Kiritimatiellia bacterium]